MNRKGVLTSATIFFGVWLLFLSHEACASMSVTVYNKIYESRTADHNNQNSDCSGFITIFTGRGTTTKYNVNHVTDHSPATVTDVYMTQSNVSSASIDVQITCHYYKTTTYSQVYRWSHWVDEMIAKSLPWCGSINIILKEVPEGSGYVTVLDLQCQ